MTRRTRRPPNPWRILFLLSLIAALAYFNQAVVPTMPMVMGPTPTSTRSAESFVNEAEQLFASGKLSQAISTYEQAVLSNPTNPANYIALARVQVYASQFDKAIANAENALILNPNNTNAYAIKAWALKNQENYLEAEASIKKALELDPNSALAHALYAEILLDKGDYGDLEEAIAESRKALQLDPGLLEAHRARGYILWGTQNYEEAIAEYKAAIAINDKLWDLHYFLGLAYKYAYEYDLASTSLLDAFTLNAANPDIPTEISRIHATVGDFPKAVQFAEQAVKIAPDNSRLHGNLGVMLYKNNEYTAAIAELTLVVRGGTTADGVVVSGLPLAPGRVADEYYSMYGLSLVKLNRCLEAVPIFQAILQGIEEGQVAYDNALAGIEMCRAAAEEPTQETIPEP